MLSFPAHSTATPSTCGQTRHRTRDSLTPPQVTSRRERGGGGTPVGPSGAGSPVPALTVPATGRKGTGLRAGGATGLPSAHLAQERQGVPRSPHPELGIGTLFFLNFYWRRALQPTPVCLPGKFYGQRSLAGCSPWGHEESDMSQQLKNNNRIAAFQRCVGFWCRAKQIRYIHTYIASVLDFVPI